MEKHKLPRQSFSSRSIEYKTIDAILTNISFFEKYMCYVIAFRQIRLEQERKEAEKLRVNL
jgi:hypothetical protein